MGRTNPAGQGRARFALIAAVLAVMGACHRDTPRASHVEEAVAITERFWAEKLPQVDTNHFTTKAEDLGSYWQIIYQLPSGSAGADWIFQVDKRTGKIVYVKGGQ